MIRFCCGVALAALLPASPVGWWPMFCVVAVLGFSLKCLPFKRRRCPLVPLLWLGLAYGCLYASWGLNHMLPLALEGEDLRVSGYVVGLPEQQINRCRFQLRVDQFQAADAGLVELPMLRYTPRKIQLSWYQCADLPQTGDHLQLVVRLKQPRSFANQGGFDFERLWFSQGIDARGYVRGLEVAGSEPRAISIDRYRQWVSGLIGTHVDAGPARGIIKAITLGDRRELSSEQWELFRQTGTIHLLVISGLHIGLVSGFVWLLMMTLLRLLPSTSLAKRRGVAVATAIIVAAIYALMAGFTLPTQRALVMTALVLLSWLAKGQFALTERIALALTLVLLLDPLAFLSAGFWLSFGATAMLLYLIKTHQRHTRWLYQVLRFQLGMSLFSIPLLAYHFYQVPLTSLLFNLLAVPVVSFLLLPITLLAVLSLAVVESSILLEWVAQAWRYFDLALVWMAEHFSFQYLLGKPAKAAVLLAVIGVLWLLSPRAVPGRMLGLVLLLPLLWPRTAEWPPGSFALDVLDVGQGLSVLVTTDNHTLLYDTGAGFASGFSIAELTVVPMLESRGVQQLDSLLISHRDNDHASGEKLVMERFKPKQTLGSGFSPQRCRAGDLWHWDGIDFEILHPDQAEYDSENSRSCVLRISSAAGSALLTGDIEADVERHLLRQEAGSLNADLLVIPHHGSRSSSTTAFIAAVNPAIAVNSAGYRNPYGHPHPAVRDRYLDQGALFYNTATSGQVGIRFISGVAPDIFEYRIESASYWRR